MYLKKVILVTLVFTCLCGCSFFPNSTGKEWIKINSDLENYYVNLGEYSGFGSDTVDFYYTLWILKIHNLLGISIEHKNKIISFIQSIDIFDKKSRELVGLSVFPLEYSIYNYLEIYYELNVAVPLPTKQKIINYYRSIRNEDGTFKVSETNQANLRTLYIATYKLLNEILPNKNLLMNSLSEEKKMKKNTLSYYYLQTLMGVQLTREDKVNITNINVDTNIENYANNEQILKRNISTDYSLMYIYKKNNLNYQGLNLIDSDTVSKFINLSVNPEQDIDPQLLYKILYIYDKKPKASEKRILENYYNALFIKNGWKNPVNTIDFYRTYLGLEIVSSTNQLEKYNNQSIINYLLLQLQSTENSLIPSTKLSLLIQCFIILENEKAIQETKKYVSKEVDSLSDKDINPIYLTGLLESILLLDSPTLLSNFSSESIIKISNLINTMETKEEKNLEELYQLSILKRFFGKLTSNERHTLKLNIENSLKPLVSSPFSLKSLDSLYYSVKISRYIDIDIDKDQICTIINSYLADADFNTQGILCYLLRTITNK